MSASPARLFYYEILRACVAFEALGDDEVQHLAKYATSLRLPAGSELFQEGDAAWAVGVISDGSVGFKSKGSPPAKAGEIFCEVGLYPSKEHVRRLPIEVLEDSIILLIPNFAFTTAMHEAMMPYLESLDEYYKICNRDNEGGQEDGD